MKPLPLEKAKAIALRKKGLSYSEILKVVPVAQASLSLWLRHIVLTTEQKKRLKDISQGVGARARYAQRLNLHEKLSQEVVLEIRKLLKDPFFILGLTLYWAEGSKEKPWRIGRMALFSNSDELTILLMRKWFIQYCGVGHDRLHYRLYVHETADIQKAKNAWIKILDISPSDLKISLKRNVVKSRHSNENYKGLIALGVTKSVWMTRRIDLWTKHAAEYFLNV